MEELANATTGKLGLYDFFNVIFSGMIFIVGIVWVWPCAWNWYEEIGFTAEKYVCAIFVIFGLGICLQEIGSVLDDNFWKIKENMLKNFLASEQEYEEYLEKKKLYRLCSKFDKEYKVFFKEKCLLGSKCKQKVAREHGKIILDKKGFAFEDNKFDPEQSKFIYAYCYYYIEILGKHTKYEKMRALYDMSRTLLSNAILLMLLGCAKTIYVAVSCNYWKMIVKNIIKTICFILLAIVFYYRTDKLAKYKARMLMSVYDVCVDKQKEILEKTKEASYESDKTATVNL